MKASLRLLLVDDDPKTRPIVVRTVQRDFDPLHAEQVIGRRRFDRALSQGDFDLVMTDSRLDWSSGIDVLGDVRSRYPDCPVIMFSSDDSEDVLARALRGGFNHCLAKSPKALDRLSGILRFELEKSYSHGRSVRREMRLHASLNRMRVGLFAMTLDGALIEANRSLLNQFGLDEDWSRSMDRFHGRELIDRNGASLLDRFTRKSVLKDFEIEVENRDGTTRWFSISAVVSVQGSVGSAASACEPIIEGMVEDITDRKSKERERLELEARLRTAQKLIEVGTLPAGIAHDFNNVLAIIRGYSDLALQDLQPESSACRMVGQIHRASSLAAALCDRMRLTTSTSKLVFEPVDLSKLVAETTEWRRLALPKNVVLKSGAIKTGLTIEGDSVGLQLVVMNLINNAVQAIAADAGVITVRACQRDIDESWRPKTGPTASLTPGPHALFEMTDTGCGMTDEVLRQIFKPFFTTKPDGQGLGLANVRDIVQAHHGAMTVDSRSGEGSTFRIFIPLTDRPVEKSPPAPPDVADGGAIDTILVVDDDIIIRRVIEDGLAKGGFDVLTASDGDEAIEVFRANSGRIGAVLLDLSLPTVDGDTAFEEMRQIRPTAKIILCSGKIGKESVRRDIVDESAGFLHKPFSLAQLRDMVRDVLA